MYFTIYTLRQILLDLSNQGICDRRREDHRRVMKIIPSYSQQDATFLDVFISKDALHVSGDSSVHHQEHTTVQTASGIVNQYCC